MNTPPRSDAETVSIADNLSNAESQGSEYNDLYEMLISDMEMYCRMNNFHSHQRPLFGLLQYLIEDKGHTGLRLCRDQVGNRVSLQIVRGLRANWRREQEDTNTGNSVLR